MAVFGGTSPVSSPVEPSISTRAKRARSGKPISIEGMWFEPVSERRRVLITIGSRGIVTRHGADPVEVLDDLTPLGLLGRAPRPRATTSTGGELESGVVLETAHGVRSLLLHKDDLAVIAVALRWPKPRSLPVGQRVADMVKLGSD